MGVIDTPNGDPKTWQIGECKITRIIEGESVVGTSMIIPGATKEVVKSVGWLDPHFADSAGRMKFAIQLMIVEAPGGIRIAIDTCLGNDKKRSIPAWNMLSSPFLKHLELAGFAPDSITHVFCTHLHTDHVGWNTMLVNGKWVPTFPNAKYLFGKKEFDHWSKPPQGEHDISEELADSVQPIIDAGIAQFVDMDHVLVQEGSTRIYLRPTVGHTPGHASLMVESGGAKAIVTGDCFHHPIQLTKIDVTSIADSDSAQAIRTREELLKEFCGTGLLMFGTHFARPTVGVVAPHDTNYKLDTAAADAFVVPRAKL